MGEESELGYWAFPAEAGEGAHPGVVMIPDVWGLSELYRMLADRLAAEGFVALAIDPYRKTGRGEFSTPPEAMAWIASLDDRVVLETIQDAIDAVAADPRTSGRTGITGFCMGGQYTLLAACRCTGLSACAPFYGMVRYASDLDPERKPASPLDALPDRSCPVLGFYGEDDAIIPVSDVEALREGLAATSHPGEIRLYAGAGHAFMNHQRPEMYREEASADAWSRLVPFLRETLAG